MASDVFSAAELLEEFLNKADPVSAWKSLFRMDRFTFEPNKIYTPESWIARSRRRPHVDSYPNRLVWEQGAWQKFLEIQKDAYKNDPKTLVPAQATFDYPVPAEIRFYFPVEVVMEGIEDKTANPQDVLDLIAGGLKDDQVISLQNNHFDAPSFVLRITNVRHELIMSLWEAQRRTLDEMLIRAEEASTMLKRAEETLAAEGKVVAAQPNPLVRFDPLCPMIPIGWGIRFDDNGRATVFSPEMLKQQKESGD